MAALQVDASLDATTVAIIGEHAPIQFDSLLRELELKVGHNRVSDVSLRRRLKVLRIAGVIVYGRIGARGWSVVQGCADE